MTDAQEKQEFGGPKLWRPRFRLGTLLIVILVVSVMAAAAGYLVRSLQGDADPIVGSSGPLVFILITLAAPMLLMIVVSITRQLIFWLTRRP